MKKFNTSIKTHVSIVLLFAIIFIGCDGRKSLFIDYLGVEMTCDSNASDYGNVLFQLKLDNQTNSKVQVFSDNFPNYGYTGFYLFSNKFKSGAIRLDATQNFKITNIEKRKQKIIWLSISVAALNNQFKYEYQSSQKLKIIKDFLSSIDYKLVYVQDPTSLSEVSAYNNIRNRRFSVQCSENQRR